MDGPITSWQRYQFTLYNTTKDMRECKQNYAAPMRCAQTLHFHNNLMQCNKVAQTDIHALEFFHNPKFVRVLM